ncbi:MAG: 50S ribosomal protein L6, partial [Deltaproteobacteria bacterium]|nr:50S ribosomal protein L6 [Deltaproteobacteria bacterium]
MSRIGKRPVEIPKGVTVQREGPRINIQGPKGKLYYLIPEGVTVEQKEGKLLVCRAEEGSRSRSQHGVSQAVLHNMVQGVAQPFQKELEIQGVGYRAEVKGNQLRLSLGFSHPVLFPIPEGILIKVGGQTKLEIAGCDKVLVGQVAANIRRLKPPEPYQGKGIRYKGEYIRLKVGKA